MSELEAHVEGASRAPAVAPWHPPPSYPPPKAQASGTDGRALASLLAAIFGILLGLPLGVPGMVLGTIAYFLGRSAVNRIDSSNGARAGRSLAVSGWVLGAVAMAIGSAVTLIWIIVLLLVISQPTTQLRMERIADAFVWPSRDPEWLTKLLIIALTLLIPVVGAINGLGWMLATLDRLRAGEDRLAPATLGYIGRGFGLFVVNLAYGLVIAVVTVAIYVPAVVVASNQSHGAANPAMVSLAILLSVLAFSIATLGSLALNFAMPSIVLATNRDGIKGGLNFAAVLGAARANIANTLIAGLMLIAAGFVGSVGLVACGIGVFFTTAYALAMQAWIIRSFEVGSPAAKAA